jgi:argininosuccinate lyase
MKRPEERDPFFWYCRMDMATTLAAVETKLITPKQAVETARGIAAVLSAGAQASGDRPTDYLDIQAMLLREAGPVASRMHAGRSRQDMLATLHRLLLRDRLLPFLEGLIELRTLLLRKAEEFPDAVVPSYTNGVQAQPVLFSHLLCGYEAPLARNTQRAFECLARLNRSPLGAAALATTRFPLDRLRIATLLGFDGVVDNAFDAAQLGLVDSGIECAQLAALGALNLNMFLQDLHAQFHHARPWILFDGPGLNSPSTLMPQKRNPVVLNRARLLGSQVTGAAMTAALAAHNLCSGLTDCKRMDAARTLDLALQQFREIRSFLPVLQVDPKAALDELELEYSSASELAAVLQERSDIPLGVCHAFCTRVVENARAERIPLTEVPHTTLVRLFTDTLAENGIHSLPDFPLSSEAYREAVHPATMVRNYRGLGGSSPEEVSRMREEGLSRIQDDREALARHAAALQDSLRGLESKFQELQTS